MTGQGSRGYFEGTDKEGNYFRIPRHIDPEIDGTVAAAHHPRLFDVTAPPDSVDLPRFDVMIESSVPSEVIGRIDETMTAGAFLAARGLADEPPLVDREWRRGMILSWSHARDLAVVHDAMAHPRDVAGHDTEEYVFARYLKERLAESSAQWYKDYVRSLDPDALVNIGFFNPHLSASLFRWGEAKGGVQNAMDAHRLSPHHLGNAEQPLDWIQRAVNFVVHHVPREHWGIRQEPRGEWSDLEARMAEDPAIKDAEIGKVIARDAARLFELLELEGKVVPWQLLKVPDGVPPVSVVEHAHLVADCAGRSAPGADDDEDEAANDARVARARRVLSSLPAPST